MMEACRFRVGKPGLLHSQDGSADTLVANGKANPAFMAALTLLPVMPRPADLDSLTVGYCQHLNRNAVPSRLRFCHHRRSEAGRGEIQLMFANGDSFRTPPCDQMLRLCDQFKGTGRCKADAHLYFQIGILNAIEHHNFLITYHHPTMTGLGDIGK